MFRLSLKAHAERLANRLLGYNSTHMATSAFYGDFVVRYWAPYTNDSKQRFAITKYSIEGSKLYHANEKHKKITAAMDLALAEQKQAFERYKKELRREVHLFSMLSSIDRSDQATIDHLLQELKFVGVEAGDIDNLEYLLQATADIVLVMNVVDKILKGQLSCVSESVMSRLRDRYQNIDKIIADYELGEKIDTVLEKIRKTKEKIFNLNNNKRLISITSELLQSEHTKDEALAKDIEKIKIFNEEYKDPLTDRNQANLEGLESLKKIAKKLAAPLLELRQKSIIVPLITIKNKIRSQISAVKNTSLIVLTNRIYLNYPNVRISGSPAEEDHDKEDIHDYLLDRAAYEISDEKSERGALRSYHHQFMPPTAQIAMPTFSNTIGYGRLLNPFCAVDLVTDMTAGNIAYGWTWAVNGSVHVVSDLAQWCCDSRESYRYSTLSNVVKGVFNLPAVPLMFAEWVTYSCAVVTNSRDGFHQLCECCCCLPCCCKSDEAEAIEQESENPECKAPAHRKSSAKSIKLESEFELLQLQITGQMQSEAARMLDATAMRFKEEAKIQKNEQKSSLRRSHSMNRIQDLLASSPVERKKSKSTIRQLRVEIPGSVSIDVEEQKSKPEVKTWHKVETTKLKRTQSACDLTAPASSIRDAVDDQFVMKVFRRRRLMSYAYHSIRKQTSEARLSITPAQTPTAKSLSKRLPFASTVVRESKTKTLPHAAQSSHGIPVAAVPSSTWGNSAPARLLKINSEDGIGKIADGSLFKNPTSPKG